MSINSLEIGYNLDLISRSELLKWSDNNLIENNNLPLFIKLSSINHQDREDKILSIINQFGNNFIIKDFNKFHKIILYFLEKKNNDWNDIREKLIKYFYIVEDKISDNDYGFWVALKDDLQLKKEGLPTRFKFPKNLIDYFNSHKIKNYQANYLKAISYNL